MRLEDLLPPKTEAEWTCGHVGGAMCVECYRILAARAHELAEENLQLRERVADLEREQKGTLVMGYVICTSACLGCGRVFSYNPVLVPSVTLRGTREPICGVCVERVNPMRIKNGLEPIVPLPGAYDACEEGEL
jgi:hypothetical protein